MKKSVFILGVLLAGFLCLTSVNAENCTPSNCAIDNSYICDDGYEFIGEYSFCTLTSCESRYFEVYQKGGNYYVKRGDKYYRLMPCDEEDYNYYHSYAGKKYYIKL